VIKAVIFDFFGVICSDEYWRFVKEDKNLKGKFHDLADSVNKGDLSWPDFLHKIANETGQPIDEVTRMYASEQINPEVVSYIDQLHKKYKTALLTNAAASFINSLVTKSHLDKVFDEIIISSEIGIIKPDPRIYEYTLDKLGVSAAGAVFIDDTVARVEGAGRLGIRAILYKNFLQMQRELEEILAGSNN
jgi:epoxide hydrolase-like predicted phosphatase